MSVSERRHKYRYGRVLMETARILSAQFDDAVLYFTGAQIEILRNLMQYAKEETSYVSEYEPGYYLSPTVADFDDVQAIAADLEETLMGNPNTIWGYEERWEDVDQSTSVGAGYTDATAGPVPAGYVYTLEYWTLVQNDDVARAVSLVITGGTGEQILLYAPNQNQAEYVYEPANITLMEGDGLRFRVYALASTKTCTLMVWGHTMVVPT